MQYLIRQSHLSPGLPLAVDSDQEFGATALDGMRAKGIDKILTYAQVLLRNRALLPLYCSKGFGVGCISYARDNGWDPSEETGAQDAAIELECMHELGVPPGWGMCDDIEGANNATTPLAMMTHERRRSGDVAKGGGYPISYLGWNGMLTSEEWQSLPNLHGYFKAGGITRDRFMRAVEPARGFMAVQGLPFNQRPVPGAVVDFDAMWQDQRGNSWPLCWAAP